MQTRCCLVTVCNSVMRLMICHSRRCATTMPRRHVPEPRAPVRVLIRQRSLHVCNQLDANPSIPLLLQAAELRRGWRAARGAVDIMTAEAQVSVETGLDPVPHLSASNHRHPIY